MDFYIIGAGGQARETWWLLKDIKNKKYNFNGFIDMNPKQKTAYIHSQSVDIIDESVFFKKLSAVQAKKSAFAIAIGTPALIKRAVAKYSGFNFPNLIHPTVQGDFETITLGKGNTVAAGTVLTVNIKIKSFNIINSNITIGHDCIIDSYNVFNAGAIVSGNVTIGNSNLLGTSSTILQNLKIGNNSVLGASALLTKNLNDNVVSVGVPARPIKTNN